MLRAIIFLLLSVTASTAQTPNTVSLPDPLVINDAAILALGTAPNYTDVNNVTVRPQAFDPTKKNLVLIMAGQSNCSNVLPSLYIPANTTVIDNFNIYNSGSYSINGPLLGTTYFPPTNQPGNLSAYLADLLISNHIFDRVILATICVGGTTAGFWAPPSGALAARISQTLLALKYRGYVPGSTGLSFALVWAQGETDNVNQTSQSIYTSQMNAIIDASVTAGFACSSVCRWFINVETWFAGTVWAPVQSAQTALAGSRSYVFAGGNLDTLGAGSRQADNIHFSNAGALSAATLIYNAMHASGPPF